MATYRVTLTQTQANELRAMHEIFMKHENPSISSLALTSNLLRQIASASPETIETKLKVDQLVIDALGSILIGRALSSRELAAIGAFYKRLQSSDDQSSDTLTRAAESLERAATALERLASTVRDNYVATRNAPYIAASDAKR